MRPSPAALLLGLSLALASLAAAQEDPAELDALLRRAALAEKVELELKEAGRLYEQALELLPPGDGRRRAVERARARCLPRIHTDVDVDQVPFQADVLFDPREVVSKTADPAAPGGERTRTHSRSEAVAWLERADAVQQLLLRILDGGPRLHLALAEGLSAAGLARLGRRVELLDAAAQTRVSARLAASGLASGNAQRTLLALAKLGHSDAVVALEKVAPRQLVDRRGDWGPAELLRRDAMGRALGDGRLNGRHVELAIRSLGTTPQLWLDSLRRLLAWPSPLLEQEATAVEGILALGFTRNVGEGPRNVPEWMRDPGAKRLVTEALERHGGYGLLKWLVWLDPSASAGEPMPQLSGRPLQASEVLPFARALVRAGSARAGTAAVQPAEATGEAGPDDVQAALARHLRDVLQTLPPLAGEAAGPITNTVLATAFRTGDGEKPSLARATAVAAIESEVVLRSRLQPLPHDGDLALRLADAGLGPLLTGDETLRALTVAALRRPDRAGPALGQAVQARSGGHLPLLLGIGAWANQRLVALNRQGGGRFRQALEDPLELLPAAARDRLFTDPLPVARELHTLLVAGRPLGIRGADLKRGLLYALPARTAEALLGLELSEIPQPDRGWALEICAQRLLTGAGLPGGPTGRELERLAVSLSELTTARRVEFWRAVARSGSAGALFAFEPKTLQAWRGGERRAALDAFLAIVSREGSLAKQAAARRQLVRQRLVSELSAKSPQRVIAALEGLAVVGDGEVLPELLTALGHPDPAVQKAAQAAVEALEATGDQEDGR